MKKFLSVLLLVLCLALPAAAETTWTVTNCTASNDTDIKYAVEHANSGDTIVVAKSIDLGTSSLRISSGKTLTLQINEDCELSASNDSGFLYVIRNDGNLTITGSGKISGSGSSSCNYVYGVYETQQGSTTIIKGSVKITAAGGRTAAVGVGVAFSSTVTIEENVKIVATDSSGEAIGVSAPVGATVNILNGTVSGDLKAVGENTTISVYGGTFTGQLKPRQNGTITVYGGTFSNEVEEDCLAPGRECKQSGNLWVVTDNSTVKFDPETLAVAQGKTGTVNVSLVTKEEKVCSLDKIEVTPVGTADGITVTPSSADGTITFEVAEACEKGSYEFTVLCTGKYDTDPHSQIGTLTVTVEGQGDDPTPSGDVKNGGCNAGFAGLALAAFALLAAKRKK